MERKFVGNISNCSISCVWTIEDFSTYGICELISDDFISYYNMNPVNWYISLHPKGNIDKARNYVSIFFVIKANLYVELYVKISILDSQLKSVNSRNLYIKGNLNSNGRGHSQFVSRAFLENERNGVLVDDKLLIKCEVSNRAIDNEIEYTHAQIYEAMDRIEQFDEFEKLLCSDMFADVALTIGEEKLPAHKNVLANRSAIFKAILEANVADIEIKGVKVVVMKELLRYMYAGKVNDIDGITFDLLDAANKYGVEGLKNLCEISLSKRISKDNAIEYLRLADEYDAEGLKENVIEYIVDHSEDIVEMPSFDSTANLKSSLLSELLRAIMYK